MHPDTPYRIALSTSKGLTCKGYRLLISATGSAKAVFDLSAADLLSILGPKSPSSAIKSITDKSSFEKAEQELLFVERNHIEVLEFQDDRYPRRLNDPACDDTPAVLYYKGNANLNARNIVAVVGSRKATPYGVAQTQRLLEELSKLPDLLVVSGLAYGIDTAAHRASVDHHISTVGVLAHGLDNLYPAENRQLARRMVDGCGGLLTEYPSGTAIIRNYFPARNRIVAAMADAVIVAEAAESGGALITAGMALGYHRDLFAIPGRNEDSLSVGCNNLIANGQAWMLRSAADLEKWMGWRISSNASAPLSAQLDFDTEETFTPNESAIITALRSEPELTLDEIAAKTNLPLSKIAAVLLALELRHKILCLAGKKYKLI